jgi:hypothetical protein
MRVHIIRNDGVGGSNPSCGTIDLTNRRKDLPRKLLRTGVKFFSVLDTILPPASKSSVCWFESSQLHHAVLRNVTFLAPSNSL